MIRLLSTLLGLRYRDLKIIKVFLFGLFYFSIMFMSMFPRFALLKWPIIIAFAITIALYLMESNRTKAKSDSFKDDNLFFRYGSRISSFILHVKFPNELVEAQTNSFVAEMSEHLEKSVVEEIEGRIIRGSHTTELLTVKDSRNTHDIREFLRFTYTGLRGGALTNFVNFEEIGSYVVINFDSHLKGIPYWYERLDFLFMSPFRIWLWIIPWIRGFFSISTAISQNLDNSFEEYDIAAYYNVSQNTVLNGIESFLEERGLLTTEMRNIIYNQLVYNNYGNQTNMNVSGTGHTIGNISQTMTAAR